MSTREELKAAVLSLQSHSHDFEKLAIEVFRFQYQHNEVYRSYVDFLGKKVVEVTRVEKIPFLPISFFKYHRIQSTSEKASIVFRSSGTTGQLSSEHHVTDLPFYEYLSTKIFEQEYGSLETFDIFALLPNYLERNDSSLVYMVKSFIHKTYSSYSSFYLKDLKKLVQNLKQVLQNSDKKVLLIGVTFALLDLAEGNYDLSFLQNYKKRITIMETGGMKGRRKEMLRDEVHTVLTNSFGVDMIHSEYGMTELLSQAYSKGEGIFKSPPSMKILLREVNDPFSYLPSFKIGESKVENSSRNKTGGINVIDLANIDSCSFIETQDLGRFLSDYSGFEVLGRFDNSEIRGCNLMVI